MNGPAGAPPARLYFPEEGWGPGRPYPRRPNTP